MVLEHLFPEEWLERKSYYAFLLGAGYSIIAIVLASNLFAKDPALPAVAITSLLLLPELYKMFSIEEKQQRAEKKPFNFKTFWQDNGDFYRVYLFLFLGILVVYSFAAMFLPSLSVNTLFKEQIAIRGEGFSAVGSAWFGQALFQNILTNNFLVLIACFIVAVLAGDGAVFLIVWNASVWGTIFGITARNAAFFAQANSLVYFGTIIITVLPHVIVEASAYILAATAGSLISKGALKEGIDGKLFGRVFKDNAYILFLAIICLIIGAGIETLVLQHSDKYAEITRLSYLG